MGVYDILRGFEYEENSFSRTWEDMGFELSRDIKINDEKLYLLSIDYFPEEKIDPWRGNPKIIKGKDLLREIEEGEYENCDIIIAGPIKNRRQMGVFE